MSLKAIELQIAIPKTVDAGKVAEQKQQQSQVNQDLANAAMERQVMKSRDSVLEAHEYAKLDADKKKYGDEQKQDSHQRELEEEKKTMHPYKGAFVDFTR